MSQSNPSVRADDDNPTPAVRITFEGKTLSAVEGETIAKALFRNGIRSLSTSIKYGRPRGIHCGRGRCIMCHVEVDGQTGVKACVTPVRDGMSIARQEYKPFYGSILSATARWIPFPAGFYYRFFTRPRPVRKLFLGMLRRLAGVGRVRPESGSAQPHPRRRGDWRASYDVVVVGAGISGMAAAVAAADAGAGVLLVDDYAGPGGHSIGRHGDAGLERARDELCARLDAAGVSTAFGTNAHGFYASDRLLVGDSGLCHRSGPPSMATVRARSFVLATGAQDLVPLYANNDLPGVFGARALRLFIERDGLIPARAAVVYGIEPEAEALAGYLRGHGVEVVATVDPTGNGVTTGTLTRADGRRWIRSVTFETPEGNERFACDCLALATPGQPSFELAQQAGFQHRLGGVDEPHDLRTMVPTECEITVGEGPARFLVGETSSRFEWEEKLRHAARVGADAARCAVTA